MNVFGAEFLPRVGSIQLQVIDLTEAGLAAAATGLLFLFQAAQLTGAGPRSSAGSASCCPQAVFLHDAVCPQLLSCHDSKAE